MRNPDIEEWLGDIETRWEYVVELDLGRIDEKASLRNQARLDPLDHDVVDRYEADMRRGDHFPPIIVRRKGDRLIVLGGNHRYTAARKAKRTLPAYLVECTDEQALRIAYEDNRRHGLPPSDAERVRQAQHLVALGWKQGAAAKVVGITDNKLGRAIAAEEFARRCAALDIVPVPNLPETSKSRLMALRADPVFIDAVDLVADADLPGGDVYEIVTTLNKARSEADARDHVRTLRALHADRIARKRAGNGHQNRQPPNPRDRLARALTEICLLDPADIARSTLTDQRRAMFEHLRRATTHIAAIDTELRR